MDVEDNRAHVRRLFRRATKADVIEAARRVAQYYEHCSRAGIPGDQWRYVLADALHLTLVDKRQKGKGRSGVDPHEGESRNYAGHYKRFYVAN